MPPPTALIYDNLNAQWLSFDNPVEILIAKETQEVHDCLLKLTKFTQDGYYAAGFVAYEAASAFEPAIPVHQNTFFPQLWFGIYKKPEILSLIEDKDYLPPVFQWTPSISEISYRGKIARIKDYIRDGHTYQVNFSFDLTSPFKGNPFDYFKHITINHPSPFAAYLDIENHAICSFSPELLFDYDGNLLKCRPMKGTAARGKTSLEDNLQSNILFQSTKDRAENIMIVDMIRNDLGQICDTGSVHVSKLFEIEKYRTILQMTSSVEGTVHTSIDKIFKALFPCASITGAPKIRTSQIIHELEERPRGIYCGSIGFVTPDNHAQFNVAIRTVCIKRSQNRATYSIGSGIVWDSTAESEFNECYSKANVVSGLHNKFQLLETILHSPDEGYFLFDNHIRRCIESSTYFNFPIFEHHLVTYLEKLKKNLPPYPVRVRLTVSEQGRINHEIGNISQSSNDIIICLAKEPVNSSDPFLYHKTTNRNIYNRALQSSAGMCDDVILVNEKGEVTETTIGNIVIKSENKMITPPIKCGVLGGTFRKHLIDTGKIEEGVITLKYLEQCDEIYRINSIRMWQRCVLKK
jgi:para-aminobenzoate synthetase/4-amino-4-deoxychorismate lyase